MWAPKAIANLVVRNSSVCRFHQSWRLLATSSSHHRRGDREVVNNLLNNAETTNDEQPQDLESQPR